MSVKIIKTVEKGSFLDDTINGIYSVHRLTEAQKGLIYEISSGVIRWKRYLDWLLSLYVKKNVKKDVRYLLWTGFYQILFMKKAYYHVVKEIVDYAKKEHGNQIASFVNAVLRRFVNENIREPVKTQNCDLAKNISVSYSFPDWLVKRWINRFGQIRTEKLLKILNKSPQFAIRVNLAKITRDDASDRLEKAGIKVRKGLFSPSALYVDKLAPVLKNTLFENGLIYIQDEASQLATWAMDMMTGGKALDACAGLGTKTRHMKERFKDILVISSDNDMSRLKMIEDRINIVHTDALASPFKDGSFDAILLDAPCSSLGIISKHPEIKWRRRELDLKRFSDYQIELLRSLWNILKKNGHLIYSVCSFEPEETTGILEKFRKETTFALENPLPFLFNKRDYFLSVPDETGMDGFFIAKLRKI